MAAADVDATALPLTLGDEQHTSRDQVAPWSDGPGFLLLTVTSSLEVSSNVRKKSAQVRMSVLTSNVRNLVELRMSEKSEVRMSEI